MWIFQYNVTLSKDAIGKYAIFQEELSFKKATSKSESKNMVFKVVDDEAKYLLGENEQDSFVKNMKEKTANLLSKASLCSLENGDIWICELVMNYGDYKIHSEYESTGIKKLIRLFLYIREMVQGGIVFIDEFDSNLHDVYLCTLLEYLMEYGEGQLCFTTHNVGPMDILKRRKKSIDFLSENHKIYSWTKSGNYSPSKLYRNGMIEGSPFNVDSIDFIGVFDVEEGDE